MRISKTFQQSPGRWAFFIILLTTSVRAWFVATHQLDLVQDEAQYWDWIRRPQLSYYSKGPLIAWLNMLGTSIFGATELGVRFAAVLNSLLVQVILWFGLARGMGRPMLALTTLFIANTMPLFLASGVLMTTDSPLLVCWVGALFSLHWATVAPTRRLPMVCLFLAMAVGILAKYTMALFIPVAWAYLFLLSRHSLLPAGVTRRVTRSLLLGAIAGAAPIIGWNIQNDFVGFRHVAGQAGVSGSKAARLIRFDKFPEYLGSQVGLLLPWWFVFMLMGAWRSLRVAVSPSMNLLHEAWATGVAQREPLIRQAALLTVGFWPIWTFFLVWSFHTKIQPNWSAVSYAAGVVLAAEGFLRFLRAPGRFAAGDGSFDCARPSVWRRLVPVWLILSVLGFAVIHGQNWVPLPEKVNPTQRLKGWTDLGDKLEELQNTKFADSAKVFYFADGYDLTASLAFYAPGKPEAYCADFGRRMNQYDLWPNPVDDGKTGWDALMIRKRFREPDPSDPLLTMFERVEVMPYQTVHRGGPGRRFTIYLCYDFKGVWPRSSSASY